MIDPRLFAASLLLSCAAAQADPGYYLVSIYENEGARSVDFRYWSVKRNGAAEVVWPEIGVSYGVSKRWTTELLASYIGPSISSARLSSLNWQNDFLLTQGQYPVDVALHTNFIVNRDRDDGYALEFGPVVQTEIGRTQLNANVFFERGFASASPGATQLKYQWQAKYRTRSTLKMGLQGFGELGTWNHWLARAQQSHRAGPVVSGVWPLAGAQAIQADAALLVGSTYGRNGSMFSLRIQCLS